AFKDHQARAKLALEQEQDKEARAAYLAMVELYRGDYVQPFYSDWCTLARDELRGAYLDARQQLALIAWRAEELDESVVHWQHMLAVDNWLEEAHHGLMRCYARQGKRGLALRQYQHYKDNLKQEFGAAPRASIQNLYQRLVGSLHERYAQERLVSSTVQARSHRRHTWRKPVAASTLKPAHYDDILARQKPGKKGQRKDVHFLTEDL